MDAELARGDKRRGRRQAQRGVLQGGVDDGLPVVAQARRRHGHALVSGGLLDRIGREAFVHIGQQVVQRALHADVGRIGAIAQPHHPSRRMLQVVARLLGRFGGDGGQPGVPAVLQRGPECGHQRPV
ncbi:hypothetical protein D3C85_1372180 [compost metagenome]